MRRGPPGVPRALALAALAALLATPLAAAYHGEVGAAGLVVSGPIAVEGSASLRAQPGAAVFEGPGDLEARLAAGVARIRVVEVREGGSPALGLAGLDRKVTEDVYELPSPRVGLLDRTAAFNVVLFTDGGLTSVELATPAGFRLERAAGGTLAPSADARGSGLDPSLFRKDAPAEGVVALAQRGVVTASGDFSLFLYGALARFETANAAYDEPLGSWTERAPTGDVRVTRFAVLALRDARLALSFTEGFRGFHAETVDFEYDGTASLASARGRAVVGEVAPVATGGPVLLSGILQGSAWPTRGGDPSVRFEARGDVTALAVGPEAASFLKDARPAAAASLAVLVLAALAWFWPALKGSLVAPLYARFSGADVMDHASRDRAFEYVREHPGASVNDLAGGLGIAWSTSAYHLRVLEREGFVVGERRGRHRRYFATGESLSPAREAVFATEHPTARALLGAIRDRPGLPQKDLAALAGVTPSTASWHLERLRAAGFVVGERAWREVRYAPGPKFGDVSGLL